jgi:hypothetical protein
VGHSGLRVLAGPGGHEDLGSTELGREGLERVERMSFEPIPDRYIFEPIEDIQYGVLYAAEKITGKKWWRQMVLLERVTVDVDNIPFRDQVWERQWEEINA